MKNWIFVIIVCVAGLVVHQIYTGSSHDTPPAEQAGNENVLPIPQQCEEKGDSLEDAIYGHETGKLRSTTLSQYKRSFQTCLREAGFTDAQINRTYEGINEAALNAEADDSRG